MEQTVILKLKVHLANLQLRVVARRYNLLRKRRISNVGSYISIRV